MADLHRCESAVVERKLAMIAELTDRRVAEHERTGGWTSTGVKIAESEIGAALTIARHHAGKLISIATTLRDRLPRVRQALARGEIDLYRATLIDDATRNVPPELIDEVERQALEKILPSARSNETGLTGRRLTNAITRIVGTLDPAGVRERRRRAKSDRYVGVSAAEDAMVNLFGSLPAQDGRKRDTRLRELAQSRCPHDPRTFEQGKADALNALVDGLAYLPCACGRDDCAQQPTDPSARVARKPLVHLIMLNSTLDGADDEPGYLDGYGLIDAHHAREVAAGADIRPVRVPEDATVAKADVDATTSTPLPVSAYVYQPNTVLDTWIRILGGMCQWLHCDTPAWNTDLDHDTPFNHDDPAQGGKTTAAGMKPYCRNHHTDIRKLA